MKTAGWFAPLVPLPTLITAPGEYLTRSGECVKVDVVSTKHNFGCLGQYENGVAERWHKSGRIFFSQKSANDIVSTSTK